MQYGPSDRIGAVPCHCDNVPAVTHVGVTV